MTVREPIPDLAEAVPVKGVRIDTMIPEAGPVQAGAAAGGRALSPLFVATVLLYATGVPLLFAFPRSASAWLDDFTPNPVIEVLRVGTGALEYTADKDWHFFRSRLRPPEISEANSTGRLIAPGAGCA